MDSILKKAIRSVVPRPVRNWLRSPKKTAQWLWDSATFAAGYKRRLYVPSGMAPGGSGDWQLTCHPSAYRVARQAQIEDLEQAEELQNFLQHCRPGMRLFDLGAHFGIFSMASAALGGTSVAVDPSSEAIRMVQVQAKLNNCIDRVRAIRAAASDRAGGIDMVAAGVMSDHYLVVSSGRTQSEVTHLDTITIDGLSHDYGLPTHIKIDVEGHEAAVLRGAGATLKASRPLVFIELHNEILAAKGCDPNEALDELDRVGYSVFGLDGAPISREVIFQKAITRVVAKMTGE